jgi:hypothetical protein
MFDPNLIIRAPRPILSRLSGNAWIGLALLALALSNPVAATPTENNGFRVLPAPAHVVIDGRTGDWDLSAGIFACDDVENQRDKYAVWLHAMYDATNLYLLARFTDETPLNNPGQTIADPGFDGDCLQFRIITAPDDPAGERTSQWTCWRGRDGADVMTLQSRTPKRWARGRLSRSIRTAKATCRSWPFPGNC